MTTRKNNHDIAETVGAEIFGAMDGTVSTLAVIAGVAGATTNNFLILVAGLAAMLAEAISMGFSSYSSARVRERILGKEIGVGKKSFKEGILFWLVTMGGGALPLSPYIFPLEWDFFGSLGFSRLHLAVLISAMFLFLIGAIAGDLTKRNPWKEGLFNAFVGMIAAAVTYAVGYGISSLVGV